MAVYRVTMKGAGIRATFSGVEIPCGFFRNEFVWARDSETAIAKARSRVMTALHSNRAVNRDLSSLTLEVDGLEEGIGVVHLFRKQGFVFHKLDEKGSEG